MLAAATAGAIVYRESPRSLAPAGADAFFQLGMMYSIGRSVPVDLVSAHKWFNIAALRGHHEAVRLRQEVADRMSEQDNTAAQGARPAPG